MGICAFIFGQLPSMASSVSGGIGLSVGNTAWRGLGGAAQKTLFHTGGKHVEAYGQMRAQRRRIESSAQSAQDRDSGGLAPAEVWEGLTNPNRVDPGD